LLFSLQLLNLFLEISILVSSELKISLGLEREISDLSNISLILLLDLLDLLLSIFLDLFDDFIVLLLSLFDIFSESLNLSIVFIDLSLMLLNKHCDLRFLFLNQFFDLGLELFLFVVSLCSLCLIVIGILEHLLREFVLLGFSSLSMSSINCLKLAIIQSGLILLI